MKYTKAFTLIELLVVMSIISVLSSVILVSTQNARKKADDAAIYKAMIEMRNAYEMEYSTKGTLSGVTPTACSLAGTCTNIVSTSIYCAINNNISYNCSIYDSAGCDILYPPASSQNINNVCKYLVTKSSVFSTGISNIINGSFNDTYSIYARLKSDASKFFCLRSNKTNSIVTNSSVCHDNSGW